MNSKECRELDKISAGATLIILVSFLIYLFLTNIKFFFLFVLLVIVMSLMSFSDVCEENEND